MANGTQSMSEKQRRMIYALTAKLGLEKPANINALGSAEASAVIDRMLEMEAEQDRKQKEQKQPAQASAQARPPNVSRIWADSGYSPPRLGMAYKMACEDIRNSGETSWKVLDSVIRATVEHYFGMMCAEAEVQRLHMASRPPEHVTGGDE